MKLLIYLPILLFHFALAEDIIVTTANGQLRGTEVFSQRGHSFYAFLQIPYAKPPVGNLRFKAPVEAGKWTGVLNATINDKICYQYKNSPDYIETEDCLYLNVYTPQYSNVTTPLPVMVFIHGFDEAFSTFDSNGPHYIIEHEIVVVTMSFRTGPFGFLTTADKVIPGNYGLKDQNLALKWVKQNIKNFGGDPDKVTIFGHSAGGASVGYHLMSKKSEGLFRAAIAMSGSVLCPFAYQRFYKTYGYRIAKHLNRTFTEDTPSTELLQYLQSVPADKLKSAHQYLQEVIGSIQILDGFWFTPVVELESDEAFITESMYTAIEKGHMNKVPLILGMCSEELIWWGKDLIAFNRSFTTEYDDNFSLFVNSNMRIAGTHTLVRVGDSIRKMYSRRHFMYDLGALLRYFGDTAFHRSIIHHAKLQSQFSDVYFYEFSYRGALANNTINVKDMQTFNSTFIVEYDDNIGLYVNSNMRVSVPQQIVDSGGAIRAIYNIKPFAQNPGDLIRYFGDTGFSRSIIHHAKLQSQFSDVYFYEFSYRGLLPNNSIKVKGCELVGHGEDQKYLWVTNNQSNLNDFPSQDVTTSERYLTLFTNFAKDLNPTSQKADLLQNIVWPKVKPDNFSYLNINENLSIQQNPKWAIYNRWVEIYKEWAAKPYDTF